MSVTDLNQTVRYICHVVGVCSKLHRDFHDYCLFNMYVLSFSRGKCFQLLLIEKLQKIIVVRYSMTNKQYFCVEQLLK